MEVKEMQKKIHLVMPMAGRGSRFSSKGYNFPKPMIKIYEHPFFYWSVRSVEKFIEMESISFVVLREHIDNYGIDKEILKYYPNARIHILEGVTAGAVITCIKGIEHIVDDYPIVFNDCDHLFKSEEFNRYCIDDRDKKTDGILLTFRSDEPKYSFVGKDEEGNITCTVEKKVVSNEAICGCYYFRNKDIFLNASHKYLQECNYSEYFMSGVYNVLLNQGKSIKSMITDFHIPFGIPEEYEVATGDESYKELI